MPLLSLPVMVALAKRGLALSASVSAAKCKLQVAFCAETFKFVVPSSSDMVLEAG